MKFKSIRFKTIFFISIVFVAAILVNSYLMISTMLENNIESNKKNIIANLKVAAKEIDNLNSKAVVMAKMLAITQENGMFGQREITTTFLKNTLLNNLEFYDSYVIYEPNADGNDMLHKNKLGSDSNGRFNSVWNNINGKAESTNGVDMETSLYYQGVKDEYLQTGIASYMITEPYRYLPPIFKDSILMVEHTYPIIINGRFVGVAGVDRTLDYINHYLNNLKPYQTADFLLVSRMGRIVVCTNDSSLLTLNYKKIIYKDILATLENIKSEERIIKLYDPVEKEDFYFAFQPIATGDWKLFIRVADRELTSPVVKTIVNQIIVVSAFFIFLLIIIIIVINSFIKPVLVVSKATEQMAKGDLTVILENKRNDEIGLLIKSVQEMTKSLHSIAQQVHKAVIKIVSTSTEIFASAKNLQNIAGDQAQFADDVFESTQQITTVSKALNESMKNVSIVVEQAKESAINSSVYLSKMNDTNKEMRNATKAISQKLAIINEKSSKITTIISTINKIAEQTDILSLNASIEAEKAGEFGRGFAVVARQIRRLSDQTSIGIMNIEAMIKDMQSAVSSGVMEMDKFIQAVEKGVQEIESVNSELKNITNQIQELSPKFNEISGSMNTQEESTNQILRAISQLTAGARNMEESLSEFNVVTGDLKEEAQLLKNEISRFKV